MKLKQNTNWHINVAYVHVWTQSPQNSVAIKRMRKQCVLGTLSSPSSVPGNEATLMCTWHHAYDSIFLPGLPPPFLPHYKTRGGNGLGMDWERPGNGLGMRLTHHPVSLNISQSTLQQAHSRAWHGIMGMSLVTHIMVLSKILKQALVFPGIKGEKKGENELLAFSVAMTRKTIPFSESWTTILITSLNTLGALNEK